MDRSIPRRGARSVLRGFLDNEAAGGGLMLIGAALLALLAANSGLAELYHQVLGSETGPALSPGLGPMTVHRWINDGLMALFFLFVGLEIKRELSTAACQPGGGAACPWSQRPRAWQRRH